VGKRFSGCLIILNVLGLACGELLVNYILTFQILLVNYILTFQILLVNYILTFQISIPISYWEPE
jgi:hypothetical protein